MPELPEVETVKEMLKKRILKRKIIDVKIYWDKIIDYPSKDKFIQDIKNQEIFDIKRRGKWLIFELKTYFLLVHLRMEGKFFFKNNNDEILKHEHVIFFLDNNKELRYHDTRKFGKMYLVLKDELYEKTPLKKLGLEPFDKNLDVNYLKEKLSNKNIPIKSSLLDQSIITGIGNIYANEILFLSGINPLRSSSSLNNKELELIIKNTKLVLNKAIKLGGTTIRSYVSLDDKRGHFQDELLVHQKEGEICSNCGSIIKKIKVGGRGTYFCSNCQKIDNMK